MSTSSDAGYVAPQHKQPPLPAMMLAAWVVFAVAVSLVSLWAHMQIGLNNDHLVLMDEVRKLAAGGIPYVDYTDVSPPLIHLLYTPPFLLAQKTGIPLYVSLYLAVYAATALSLLASDAILRASGTDRATRWLAVGAISLALLSSSFMHQAFADRDHLMMTLAAPWLVLCSPLARRESVPAKWRMAAAAMAATGFAIKPYFYVFYLATFAFALLHRPLRGILREREHHIIWGFAALYVAVVFAYFPQYPFTVLPVGLQTYGGISWSWGSKSGTITGTLLGGYGIMLWPAALLLLLMAPRLFNRSLAYLFLLLAASTVSYAVNSGWYYTQYPFAAVALVLAVALTARLMPACQQRIRTKGLRPACMLSIAACMSAGMYHYYAQSIIERAQWDIRLQREHGHTLSTFPLLPVIRMKLDGHFEQHPRFMFLTLDLWSVNLLRQGTPRENVSRFDILWPLPGILKMQPDPARREQCKSLLSWLTQSLASDIERHRPDMIINDISPVKRALPHSYNIIGLLEGDPRFAAAMRAYEKVDTLQYCDEHEQSRCAYEIYYRR